MEHNSATLQCKWRSEEYLKEYKQNKYHCILHFILQNNNISVLAAPVKISLDLSFLQACSIVDVSTICMVVALTVCVFKTAVLTGSVTLFIRY
jgi:hypothetical protein